MKKIKIKGKYFHFTLILIIINLILLNCESKKYNYTMEISTEGDILEVFFIKGGFCEKWIPSLLYSLPIVDMYRNASDQIQSDKVNIINPLVSDSGIDMYLYKSNILLENFNVILAKPRSSNKILDCYFGMSYRNGDNKIDEAYILLNYLKNNDEISEKIFSFDKWTLNKTTNNLETKLYFGYSHDDFSPNNENGIVGTCPTDEDDKYWGCKFDQMSFNGSIVDLYSESHPYKIYFSSESHSIIFPLDFENTFNNLTYNQCEYDSLHPKEDSYFLSCDNFFNETGYAKIKLIRDNMIITLEIDNVNRYNKGNQPKNKTRIRYEKNDYFIFPLIMFKNFHVQFDYKNNLTKFYTTDESILQVTKEEETPDENKGGSKGLKTFIVILIILLVIALLFLGFWLYKKRKGSLEKDINKYHKFDEDENFQTMNEKRVF